MNDARESLQSPEPAPGSDETLSAYLLGELDDAHAKAFEARLTADPGLAARLDALAGALAELGGVDQVPEPDGFAARLDARLAAESAAADLDERRRRRQRWSAGLTAAAGVAVLAVAGLQVLDQGGVFLGGADLALEESSGQQSHLADDDAGSEISALRSAADGAGKPDEQQAGEADLQPYDSAYAPAPEPASGGSDAGEAGSAPAPEAAHAAPGDQFASGPVIVDEGAELDDDEDLRARFMSLPEAERFRAMPREQAIESAARHADEVRAAEPFSSGVRPDACLDEVGGGPDGRIVARVERIRWQGGETLAYVLVLPRPGSAQVDAFELWLTGPQGCDTRRFLTWQ